MAPVTPYKIDNVELQDRDFEILADLFQTRFTTVRHAAAVFFDCKEPATRNRLNKLAAIDLLKKQPVNLAICKVIYVFAKRALDVLIEQRGLLGVSGEHWESTLRKRYTVEIAATTLQHELAMLDVRAALQVALKTRDDLKLAYFHVWPAQCEFPVVRGARKTSQQPDGFLRINTAEGPAFFYVELDRSTEGVDKVIEKLDGYLQHKKQSPDPFRVLFIIDAKKAEGRRDALAKRFSQMKLKNFVWLTTLEEFTDSPLSAISSN